ncbi:hypothetical protein VFPPC_15747 [Pochonia chlamydosporia 170]|uniref:Uncharacterized protein n=1 Tax=Pochonia chlamydosporia 170 TaxID=1380566 RepID=A0A179FQL9_METCM|nr:hypothetical protein VFPPC_15747 [Pochonia chlamydosporia 170]OAQ67882.1 hypothetical protein VFPPC_15747 [Pochonia chlamydosporia 170]
MCLALSRKKLVDSRVSSAQTGGNMFGQFSHCFMSPISPIKYVVTVGLRRLYWLLSKQSRRPPVSRR